MSWKQLDGELVIELVFNDFNQAFGFMTQVAMEAEKLNHHPTMVNTFNSVELRVSTHDGGGAITAKDHDFAKAVDRILDGGRG